MENTKSRILLTALRLFASEGYEGTSVADIASELGITKGALYRHYAGKRDIFDSILREMERRDSEMANISNVPEGPIQEMTHRYQETQLEDFALFSKEMFRYWTQDEFAANFRRMLTLEQYRSEEMGQLYQQYLADGPMNYTADIFAALDVPEARQSAAKFYGAMFLLYTVYDRAIDRERVLALAEECIDSAAAQLDDELRRKRV